ncbi:kinase-like domain-containing protein [Corynascus novoguineensis]|uniref:mitogen-activated protein kinase kinase n=1 Tax=Corynascus novoguineensis TaxID=1126955 RepID=A0AAN7D187_9PEZI|nr:kinase-like domain-containing protein [Corynascus novoguineensis]
MLHHNNLEFLGLGNNGYVYKCPGGFAYKMQSSDREVDFMKAAGDCSVTPVSRVMEKPINGSGMLMPSGLIMELATPFNFKLVPPEECKAVMDEMVGLVERLHSEFRIVHGDIKPANFLRCRDGKLRLCDFDSARFIADETADGWQGIISDRYLAPNRGYPDMGPPTVIDDNYALAISLWELFTGKDALIDEDMEDILPKGKTVDLTELEDDGVRDFVRRRLREGGAKV